MRRITTYILLLLATTLTAQITLDKHYGNSCVSTKINATDYKLFAMDDVNNECRIYNLDHSLYKTIDLTIPSGKYLYDVRFVTQDLFNTNNKIELLYVYYDYVETDATTQTGYYNYYTRVIDEDGGVLLNKDGGLYSSLYKIADEEYRLFIYSYDYSSWPYESNTDIYKLGGYPHFLASTEVTERSASIENAYPNPASEYATIGYALPDGVREANLNIYSMSGKQVGSFRVDRQFTSLRIPTGSFLPGEYLYRIETEDNASSSKQILIK